MDARAGITHSAGLFAGSCFQHDEVLLLLFVLIFALVRAFSRPRPLFRLMVWRTGTSKIATCALSLMGPGTWIGSYFNFSPAE